MHITQVHEQIRHSKCDLCEKSFKRSAYLAGHKSTHKTENKFQCKVCESKLKTKSTLEIHMRMHTGEKQYQCNECNKFFRQLAHLKCHIWDIHSTTMYMRNLNVIFVKNHLKISEIWNIIWMLTMMTPNFVVKTVTEFTIHQKVFNITWKGSIAKTILNIPYVCHLHYCITALLHYCITA